MMNKETFWYLIDTLVKEIPGLDCQVCQKRADLLVEKIAKLSKADAVMFENIWRAYKHHLSTDEVYEVANEIDSYGLSDDGFTDFQGWAMINGQKVVEAIVKNPKSLYEITGCFPGTHMRITCESAGYVPMLGLDKHFGQAHYNNEEYKKLMGEGEYDLSHDSFLSAKEILTEKYGKHYEVVLALVNVMDDNWLQKDEKIKKIQKIVERGL